MNIKNRLRHLASLSTKDRATGRTTRLIEMAMSIGGIFITHNQDAADFAQRKHKGLVARSIETNLEGYSGPFVFDHFAVENMFSKAAQKIDNLEQLLENERQENVKHIQEKYGFAQLVNEKNAEIEELKTQLRHVQEKMG